ncbi:MAG: APC family permease [Acidobacteriaceae bacterium]|nr:APC family permease [Acidobacteriaceae bacterium]MBV9779095.1 APC family permease [Acidobacteriaceae bacterium]
MAATKPALRKELGLRDLVLFNVAALLSTRWIGVAAHVGPGAIGIWVLAAALFLVPCAFVVANLSRKFPEEGGLYIWTREAFGEWHAFACGWFYYLSNVFWIPGVLVASIGMLTYAFSPSFQRFAENPSFVLPIAVALLVLVVASNYVGLRVAKWVDNFGGLGAYVIVIVLLTCAVAAWMRPGPATKFNVVPSFDLQKLNFWSQFAFAMTGLELSPILAGEIRDARRNIFRATWICAVLVVLYYVGGTGSILTLLPPDKVSPVVGLAQAGQEASNILGWRWPAFAIGLCIVLSVGGQLGTYVGACARLPFVLGIANLLPQSFAKLHPKYGTPYFSILFLGITGGVLLFISQLGETFRGAYQLGVDLSVISLFIPFLYLFGAAWKFGQKWPALCGLFVSAIAILFSFLPTADVRSAWWFEAKLIGGSIIFIAVPRIFYMRYRARAHAL